MGKTIAISGKGGAGKTTIAAMIIRSLVDRGSKPVLAVDADPNACLGLTMGAEAANTVAKVRELARTKEPNAAGGDRLRSFEYGIQGAITEGAGFDLLTMGQPEGPDCYCAANNLLRKFLDKLSSAYNFVVLDNEAGMEHLSRRTTNNVDLLCIVADPTPIGEITAKRIYGLTETLPIIVKRTGIIWNRSDSTKSVDGIESLGCIPFDQAVQDAAMAGKTVFELEADTAAFSAVSKILEQELEL